jgi:hypothetical protein
MFYLTFPFYSWHKKSTWGFYWRFISLRIAYLPHRSSDKYWPQICCARRVGPISFQQSREKTRRTRSFELWNSDLSETCIKDFPLAWPPFLQVSHLSNFLTLFENALLTVNHASTNRSHSRNKSTSGRWAWPRRRSGSRRPRCRSRHCWWVIPPYRKYS